MSEIAFLAGMGVGLGILSFGIVFFGYLGYRAARGIVEGRFP